MNNLLDLTDEKNQIFIASVLCVLCEEHPVTVDLTKIEKFWYGELVRLQYDLVADIEGKQGSITFSLKEKV